MWNALNNFFYSGNFIPHGHCYLWKPELVWLNVISDSLIALAYYSIPVLLIYFVSKRKDLPFDWMFLLFGAFIISCGTTHLLEVWTLWYPHYWVSSFLKVITALVSMYTALELVPLLPKALALPSPAQLEAANQALKDEIIERQRIEQELREYKEDLEELVKRRTTELATTNEILHLEIAERKQSENRLAQLLEEVKSANQELNDFAYVVSHDLKAPLRGISSIADWLLTDYATQFDQEGKELISLMISRVHRLHNLIDGILEYSRVGRLKEQIIELDLNKLVPEAIDLVALQENIAIKIENYLPSLYAEKTRIKQLFHNLIGNAAKFMDKPQGQIRIGCQEEEDFWKFWVSDNGPGIEARYFGKIFQIFQRLSSEKESNSTGIGLAIVKKIVEMYGGKIWVESEFGNGSTFFFTLPVSRVVVISTSTSSGI